METLRKNQTENAKNKKQDNRTEMKNFFGGLSSTVEIVRKESESLRKSKYNFPKWNAKIKNKNKKEQKSKNFGTITKGITHT